MTSQPSPVLIVGGGPSGLVLALLLLQNGVPVRIVEKQYAPRLGQRGAGIMPRSLELFSHLRIIDDVVKEAIPIPLVRKYQMPDGAQVLEEFVMAPNLDPTPSNPFLNPLLLGQDRLETIFHAALAKYGCIVEKGTELESFTQYPDHVEVRLVKHHPAGRESVHETARYAWVVGTDGAKGVMRKKLGLGFLGETRTVENFVVGDICVEGLSSKYWHMWGDATTVLVSLRPTETPGLFNFIIAGKDINHAEIASSDDTVRQCFRSNIGRRTDLKFGKIPWMSYYTPNIRMVETFGKGRIFIAGDAGHVHSPTGGQGMNTGIQDSLNLGWKLALVAKNYASPSLLDTYTEERIPVIREMLEQTTKLLNKTFSETDTSPWNQVNQGGSLLQLGVNYRWSSALLDERKALDAQREEAEDAMMEDFDFYDDEDEKLNSYGNECDGRLRAGDRAPDASGLVPAGDSMFTRKPMRLFQIFGVSHHTALVFSSLTDSGKALQELSRYPKDLVKSVIISKPKSPPPPGARYADFVLEDKHGHAHDAYATNVCGIILVRPDGIVGEVILMLPYPFVCVIADDNGATFRYLHHLVKGNHPHIGWPPNRERPVPFEPLAVTLQPNAPSVSVAIMTSQSRHPLLIVGSGPSGLVLAISLAKNGIPVRIIEKRHGPAAGQRGAAIQPRVLELFHHLDVIDDVLDRSVAVPIIHKYKAPKSTEVLQEIALSAAKPPTPDKPYPNPVCLGQDNLEDILRSALEKIGHEVEYGSELVFLNQTDTHVEVRLLKHRSDGQPPIEETLRYEWVVGADGAKGQVRRQIGLGLLGETIVERATVVGDVVLQGLDPKFWHMWGDVFTTLASFRPTEKPNLFSFIFGGKDIDAPSFDGRLDKVREVLQSFADGIEVQDIPWMSVYTPNIRMAKTFHSGRVFLVGDAAHVHSPAGGQGMNSGVQDSMNLGWKLASVIKGYSSPAILESYSDERIPVIAEVLNLSSKLQDKFYVPKDQQAHANFRRDESVLQLGINYRWSSIVVDERRPSQEGKDGGIRIDPYGRQPDGGLQAGDRAPDSPGIAAIRPDGVTRLFQIFCPHHHTVLFFPELVGSTSTLLAELGQYPQEVVKSVVVVKAKGSPPPEVEAADFVLEDRGGHAYATYVRDNANCGVFVVRPDGVVGGILKGSSDSLHSYFRKIFSI